MLSERVKHPCERETLIGCLVGPPTKDRTATETCAVARDRTCNLSGYATMLQPAEPPRPGLSHYFLSSEKDTRCQLLPVGAFPLCILELKRRGPRCPGTGGPASVTAPAVQASVASVILTPVLVCVCVWGEGGVSTPPSHSQTLADVLQFSLARTLRGASVRPHR